MATKEKLEATAEQKLIGRISGFASANKKGIVAGVVALVAVLVIVLVVIFSASASYEKKIDKLVAYNNQYDELIANYSLDDGYSQNFADLIVLYQDLISGKNYVSAKAQYQIGVCYYRMADYECAYEAFSKAAEMSKKYYLSSLALMNKAVCAEALNNTEEAKLIYDEISNLKDVNGLAPKALFNLGRIAYQEGQTELAKTYFEEVAATYPNSEYGKLAVNVTTIL